MGGRRGGIYSFGRGYQRKALTGAAHRCNRRAGRGVSAIKPLDREAKAMVGASSGSDKVAVEDSLLLLLLYESE